MACREVEAVADTPLRKLLHEGLPVNGAGLDDKEVPGVDVIIDGHTRQVEALDPGEGIQIAFGDACPFER